MDSPASAARGRGRLSARKRHTLPSVPSHPNSTTMTAAELVDQLPSSTPADSIASSSFETPSPTASRGMRARARVAEGAMPSSDDLDNKGGRSLRKRARVDYTFDHADEYMSDSSKAAPSSTRALKRRRTEANFINMDDLEAEFNGPHIKRRSSEQLPPPPSAFRRRNQVRKSTLEPQPLSLDQQMEDVEVQDTIEVGGHQSEQSDESTLRRTSSNTSSGFSNEDSKPSHMTASFDSIPTPRTFQSNPIRIGSDDDHHQTDVELREAVRMSLADDSKNIADISSHPSHEHLTPYIEGAFSEWPPAHSEIEPVPGSQPLQQDATEETADDQLDGIQLDSIKADIAQEDTPMTDPLVPDSTPLEGPMDETPAMSPLPTDTRMNSPTVDADIPYIQPPKPISFKKTRDASEFISLFENHKSLSPEEVWRRLEVVNRALVAWQDEYHELRKITDDEDNAVRYRQEEAAFEHRLKMLTSKDPFANPIRKDFIVKGVRAERPNPEITYARHQDKLMATNYGFDYDDKDSKIGCQDPLEQKTGSGKGRLRDRPKQTAKAAEADDGVVVHGKRARKPPVLFDGSEVASRGSTPVPMQRRRRRAGYTADENGEANLAVPTPTTSFTEQAPPKKKGKGGRPRKHPLPVPIPEPTSAPAEELHQQPDEAEEEKPIRKRRRRRTAAQIAEDNAAAAAAAAAANSFGQQGPTKAGLRRTDSRLSEVPTGSFYTSSMQSTNAADESRPPTSSSTATQSTVASNYQLREKRQKKFSINPDEEVHDAPPKRKRGRKPKNTQVEDFAEIAAPVPVPSPPSVQRPSLEPHQTPKPPTKIKLKNYTAPVSAPPAIPVIAPSPFSAPSSSNSTPPHSSNGINNGALNGTDPADIKDYNQMTKSEKMSHSMKARWASGSMSQAVAKRRATLANKKQAVKAAEPGQPLEPTSFMSQP
ncbi:hypothetical protein EV127DRAFT_244888 [Xylaria flabelliformis]|nr:hypothetical protein EV127DRAFT_244888 [Xylaria flabelliformis]